MTKGPPLACSLGASDLQHRLSEIAAIGTASLIERSSDGDCHLLRFRPTDETRRRLKAIIAAETKCCSFLHLSLEDRDDALVLSIGAPEDGRLVADELAAAFANT